MLTFDPAELIAASYERLSRHWCGPRLDLLPSDPHRQPQADGFDVDVEEHLGRSSTTASVEQRVKEQVSLHRDTEWIEERQDSRILYVGPSQPKLVLDAPAVDVRHQPLLDEWRNVLAQPRCIAWVSLNKYTSQVAATSAHPLDCEVHRDEWRAKLGITILPCLVCTGPPVPIDEPDGPASLLAEHRDERIAILGKQRVLENSRGPLCVRLR